MSHRHVDAIGRLVSWKRTRLVRMLTPLRPAPRLAAELGLSDLLIKMDAETGFALGGNKVRKLEFELSPDRLDGVTALVTAGGPQSNHCRVTAAFAARHGLRCVIVTQAPEPDEPTGNALLHRLFGAEIVVVPDRADRVPGMEREAARLEQEGETPRIVPIGASTAHGSLGYALAAGEIFDGLALRQFGDARRDDETFKERGKPFDPTAIFVSASSCGTIAGLHLGLALAARPGFRLVGVSADAPVEELLTETSRLATEAAEVLETDADLDSVPVSFDDSHVGEGYGIPTDASREAIELTARLEGIVLDPTYTAKAMAGLMAAARAGELSDERVVFVHTGGAPSLLA